MSPFCRYNPPALTPENEDKLNSTGEKERKQLYLLLSMILFPKSIINI